MSSSRDFSSRVLMLGGSGYLGQGFLSLFPDAAQGAVDVADRSALGALLDERRPDIVINCAGKTGRPNVDWCEDHKLETLRANVTGALVTLEECLRRDIYLVHLSSACIYEGSNGGQGYTEQDAPNFFGSFYSRTKAWSDQAMGDFPVLTLRPRMPFDGTISERNLIMKLRGYSRVLTEPNSLTCLPDFLHAAAGLIAQRATGVFNVVNQGTVSPYEIMTRYRELVDPGHRCEPISAAQLEEVVRSGRSNCVLSTKKLAARGLQLPPVSEAIDRCLRELAGRLNHGRR